MTKISNLFHVLVLISCLIALMFIAKPEVSRKHVANNEASELKNWLGLKEVSSRRSFEDALNLRHNGTGNWFLKEPVYQKWLLTKNSLLWVYGIRESHKTLINVNLYQHQLEVAKLSCRKHIAYAYSIGDANSPRATIIQSLQAKVLNSKSGLVYFYLDHRNAAKQTLQSFTDSALSQLLPQCPACMNDVKELRSRKTSTLNQKPNQQEYFMLLKAFTLHFDRVFVVVDALDESSEVEKFVDGLAEIIHGFKSGSRAQVLVTSRYEVEIRKLIEPIALSTFSLTAKIGVDISRYVSAEVHSRILTKKLQLRAADVEEEIINHLSEGAEGM